MSEAIKEINLPIKAAGFSSERPKLSDGQWAIHKLIKDKAESGQPIVFEDISKIYITTVKRGREGYHRTLYQTQDGEKYSHWEWIPELPEYQWTKYNRKVPYREVKGDFVRFDEEYGYRSYVLNWFQRNLGAAIMKGKILAIPVIQIE